MAVLGTFVVIVVVIGVLVAVVVLVTVMGVPVVGVAVVPVVVVLGPIVMMGMPVVGVVLVVMMSLPLVVVVVVLIVLVPPEPDVDFTGCGVDVVRPVMDQVHEGLDQRPGDEHRETEEACCKSLTPGAGPGSSSRTHHSTRPVRSSITDGSSRPSAIARRAARSIRLDWKVLLPIGKVCASCELEPPRCGDSVKHVLCRNSPWPPPPASHARA